MALTDEQKTKLARLALQRRAEGKSNPFNASSLAPKPQPSSPAKK